MNLFGTNCKPGDVAMVTRDAFGICNGREYHASRGTFVYIIRMSFRQSMSLRRVRWRVEPFRVTSVCGRFCGMAEGVDDSVLKPIRPGDGEDEMLRIAGKPVEKSEPRIAAPHCGNATVRDVCAEANKRDGVPT